MRSSHQKRHGFPSGARMTPRLFSCFTGSGSLSASDPSRIYFRGSAACRWNEPAHTEECRIPSPSGSAAKPEGPILSPACACRVALPSRPTGHCRLRPVGGGPRPSPSGTRLVQTFGGSSRGGSGLPTFFRCAHRSVNRAPVCRLARGGWKPRDTPSLLSQGPGSAFRPGPAASFVPPQNATKTTGRPGRSLLGSYDPGAAPAFGD